MGRTCTIGVWYSCAYAHALTTVYGSTLPIQPRACRAPAYMCNRSMVLFVHMLMRSQQYMARPFPSTLELAEHLHTFAAGVWYSWAYAHALTTVYCPSLNPSETLFGKDGEKRWAQQCPDPRLKILKEPMWGTQAWLPFKYQYSKCERRSQHIFWIIQKGAPPPRDLPFL